MTGIMDKIRKQILDDEAALPGLHEQATGLGLHPQPWWNREFYSYKIKAHEAELEQEQALVGSYFGTESKEG